MPDSPILPPVLRGSGYSLPLDRPRIMGILNVTPDSFSDGGRYQMQDAALKRAEEMVAEGVDLIDIGGESTRPGAPEIPLDEELARVIPIVAALRRNLDLPLSIDTTKSEVAAAALEAGADFINDVSGLSFDPMIAQVVAKHRAGLFLMHTRGRPAEMQNHTTYHDLLAEIIASLRRSTELALAAGVPRDGIAVDPGIGFGKDLQGNLQILQRLNELQCLDFPILLGTSRKGFIGQVLQLPTPLERLYGSLATIALGVNSGVRIFRVHDVRASREVALMSWAIARA